MKPPRSYRQGAAADILHLATETRIMATTKAPLFGLDASGTLGGSITFSKWRGRTYVRRHAVPSNPKSGLQVGMRACFKYITQAWASLTSADQEKWSDLAAVDNITKLNAMVRDGQALARRNVGFRKTPDAAAGTTPDQPTGGAAAAQPKTLVLSWTRPVANQGDYVTMIFRSKTTGFTHDISNLVGVIDVTKTTYTDINLLTGTEYYYVVCEVNSDGEIGTASAEFNGTPT